MKHSFLLLSTLITMHTAQSQNSQKEVIPQQGTAFLLGKISVKDLTRGSYNTWYQSSYESYEVDTATLPYIKKNIKHYELKLFLGTWCGDSKREVPRILKILEQADYPMDLLEIIALDKRPGNYKKGPNGEEKGWKVTKVPTLVFLKDGQEVNRIVERPLKSLEKDMVAILKNRGYLPRYSKN
ncbi:Hypothetical protein I595_1999 [Croceitalea dokdonensis DOKDO 023]|uniref:Thioredoxin family protein n=1 Tax=Croceitalea dokdonensis DOKDO 023 TaxID=1300341 RepID=A0A0P7A6H5_9FLAO|nr:thioredoxin family protein [Croceitalea dokdonensis]KPM32347.1 Hypothetical protein I595_1999 [Croceitalea dokdonensis DOKDO 023]